MNIYREIAEDCTPSIGCLQCINSIPAVNDYRQLLSDMSIDKDLIVLIIDSVKDVFNNFVIRWVLNTPHKMFAEFKQEIIEVSKFNIQLLKEMELINNSLYVSFIRNQENIFDNLPKNILDDLVAIVYRRWRSQPQYQPVIWPF